jgi:hypothetical protein
MNALNECSLTGLKEEDMNHTNSFINHQTTVESQNKQQTDKHSLYIFVINFCNELKKYCSRLGVIHGIVAPSLKVKAAVAVLGRIHHFGPFT